MDIEVILGMTTLEDIKVGIEKDSIQVILVEMSKVVVDSDQVQEQVPVEIGFDVLNVGSMIILPRLSEYIRYRKGTVRADTVNT